MGARRLAAGLAVTALLAAFVASAPAARAQVEPGSGSTSSAEQNAAIVRPLIEIGRVRARSPYCAALARARPGIDAALTYEYSVPLIAQDFKRFRLDSDLTKAQSLDRLERDLHALANLALLGRAEVRALRTTASAETDEKKRQEMLDFANALDGAKERQMTLARGISRVFGELAETPARVLANAPSDDHGAAAFGRSGTGVGAIRLPRPTPAPSPASYTAAQADAITDNDRTRQLFSAFAAEDFIREDLKVAAKHGTAAMQLGGCNT